MRILLLQVRNSDDPMLAQERRCFSTKLKRLDREFAYELDFHNVICRPCGFREKWRHYDLIMVGGSGDYGCVRNEEPWFQEFCDVLRDIVEVDKPLFCSCFGHQALAVALGGAVDTDKSKAELGTLEVTLNEHGRSDPLLGQLDEVFPAQFGHNDFVSELPRGAVNLAHSDLCAVQAYRLEGKMVYATQFHPELSHLENLERANRYMSVYDPELTKSGQLEKLFRPSQGASELLPRFVEMVRNRKLTGR